MPMSERIMELEFQLAHLQRLYDQLNEVVTNQALAYDRLQRQLTLLQSQVKNIQLKSLPPEDPLSEKPPHY